MELFNAPNLDAFDGAEGGLVSGHHGDEVRFYVAAINGAITGDSSSVPCKNEEDCILEYSRKYTPLIADIVPNQIYKD